MRAVCALINGASWFRRRLVPSTKDNSALDEHNNTATSQLTNGPPERSSVPLATHTLINTRNLLPAVPITSFAFNTLREPTLLPEND